MKYDREKLISLIDNFFIKVDEDPHKMSIDELIVLIDGIIPVHAGLEINDYDQVDVLLGIYPYLFQKLTRLYAHFIHEVRIAVSKKEKLRADIMRSYRDPLEQMLRAIRLQYDALSRRLTNNIERRG